MSSSLEYATANSPVNSRSIVMDKCHYNGMFPLADDFFAGLSATAYNFFSFCCLLYELKRPDLTALTPLNMPTVVRLLLACGRAFLTCIRASWNLIKVSGHKFIVFTTEPWLLLGF